MVLLLRCSEVLHELGHGRIGILEEEVWLVGAAFLFTNAVVANILVVIIRASASGKQKMR